jgi:hypothetical protein
MVRVSCDIWEQASHNGELVHTVEAGLLACEQVTELGSVLAKNARGRAAEEEITAFDSTVRGWAPSVAFQDSRRQRLLDAFDSVSPVKTMS